MAKDPITVEIKGLEELKKSLKIFPQNVQRNILISGVRAEASAIKKRAAQLAPKRTGTLKKSLKVKKLRSKNKERVMFTIGATYGKDAKYDGHYAHMVEFGTKKMRAQPFMRPAYEELKDKAIVNVSMKIRQRVDREIKRSNHARS